MKTICLAVQQERGPRKLISSKKENQSHLSLFQHNPSYLPPSVLVPVLDPEQDNPLTKPIQLLVLLLSDLQRSMLSRRQGFNLEAFRQVWPGLYVLRVKSLILALKGMLTYLQATFK